MQISRNADFAKIFDGAAAEYDGICHPYALARRRDFVASYLRNGDRVLEVGAANGGICGDLNLSIERVACDISFEMCRVALEKRQLDVVCCDAEFLPFPDQSFDVVVATEVIYYLHNPKKFLTETFRVLKPGGRILLTTANQRMVWMDRLRAVLRTLGMGGTYFDDGIRRFTKTKDLCAWVRDTGFEHMKMQGLIFAPHPALDGLNRVVEKTPLKNFALFIAVSAEKK